MQKDIIHTWFLVQPPSVVWDYLTQPELLSQWLMANNFKPEVGHKFRFTANPKVKFGFDGIVYCEVLEVEPLKRLSYSWKGGPGNGRITLDTVVTWTLRAKDGGTELRLEHKGFSGFKNYFAYLMMNNGWGGGIRKRLTVLLKGIKNETTAS